MTFNVYTGDGNDGTSFDHEIDAPDLDSAVKVYMDGVDPKMRGLFDEDGDDTYAALTVYEGPNGERAINDSAYFCAEIYPSESDPRC